MTNSLPATSLPARIAFASEHLNNGHPDPFFLPPTILSNTSCTFLSSFYCSLTSLYPSPSPTHPSPSPTHSHNSTPPLPGPATPHSHASTPLPFPTATASCSASAISTSPTGLSSSPRSEGADFVLPAKFSYRTCAVMVDIAHGPDSEGVFTREFFLQR